MTAMSNFVPDLAVVLTVRNGSERFPHKAMARVGGKALLAWIVQRVRQLGPTVIATTSEHEDDEIVDLAAALDIACYRGPTDDVVSRVLEAVQSFFPSAQYVLRALGDQPFLDIPLVSYAVSKMAEHQADAFTWAMAPYCWPVYGAREFPYSIKALERINAHAEEREHLDSYFHEHRGEFRILYHTPPPNLYLRPYRLEVDWLEDLNLVQGVAAGPGMLAPLPDILRWLDRHEDIARANRSRVEKTGPSTYPRKVQRKWLYEMKGKPILDWTGEVWEPPSPDAMPIYCAAGSCLLGFGDRGALHRPDRTIIKGNAFIQCSCGTGRVWV